MRRMRIPSTGSSGMPPAATRSIPNGSSARGGSSPDRPRRIEIRDGVSLQGGAEDRADVELGPEAAGPGDRRGPTRLYLVNSDRVGSPSALLDTLGMAA